MQDGATSFDEQTPAKLATLAEWMRGASTIVWFTGAGISTESGVPDYRGPNGVWTRRDKGLPPPEPSKPLSEIEPNAAHRAIVEFEKRGKCAYLISQNIDNLHLESGYPWEKLAELHGNKKRLRCGNCEETFAVVKNGTTSAETANRNVEDASDDCPLCGGPLGDGVIHFGDAMPRRAIEDSFEWAKITDLLIVVGSTCLVTPAADVPVIAKTHGARLVVMNIGETGVDELCDLRFSREKAGELLAALFAKFESIRD